MKSGFLVCLVSGLALAGPAASAEEVANVVRVVIWEAKPGATAELEAGVKRHNAFHAKQQDPGAHHTYSVISGPNAGSYLRVASGRKWSDFDAEESWAEADAKDSAANVDLHLALVMPMYYVFQADISRPLESPSPSKMYSLVHHKIRSGHVSAFRSAVKRFHEAIGKTSWPVNYAWFALVNGGSHPAMTVSLPRSSWADFNPPETPFEKMLAEAVGPAEAESLRQAFDAAVERADSEILAYRPDLSYEPAAK